jgi:hypothetical protein
MSLSYLANAYLDGKQYASALKLYRQLAAAQSQLARDDPDCLATQASIGRCLHGNGQAIKAEIVLWECLALRERKQPNRWVMFRTKASLGAVLLAQKKYAEAEKLLLDGYQGMKRTESQMLPAMRPPYLAEVLEWLVHLYDEWGKEDQARMWRKTLAALKKSD